jgi:hypothetical protein
MPGVDLFFVHGTWSDGAAFSDETSPFFQVLSKSLGTDLQVHRFPWSGGNSVRAREVATDDFTEAIRSRANEAPKRVRIVLCHSHGGSVVMGGLARATAKLPLDALITIGTPYIYVNRFSSVDPGVPPPFGPWLVIGLLVLGVILTVTAARDFLATTVQMTWGLIAAHPLMTLGCLVFIYLLVALIATFHAIVVSQDPGGRKMSIVFPDDDAIDVLRRRCLLPTAEVVPTLLLKVPGDEAHGALASAQFLSWILQQGYSVPIRSLRTLRERLEAFISDKSDDAGGRIGLAVLFFDFCCVLPLRLIELALRLILSPLVVALAAVLSAPYGLDFLRVAGAAVLAIGDTPPGDWRVVYVPPFDVRDYRRQHSERFANADVDMYDWDEFDELEADLSRQFDNATRGTPHSRAYADPRVASIIAEWLRARVLKEPRPAS